MHWTKLLENRRIPPDARVVEDLPCIGCGYNLLSCRADARCPECGLEVAESLYVIRCPDETAAGLRGLAHSYLGLVGLIVGVIALVLSSSGAGFIAAGLLFLASILRVVGTIELRFKARLENIPLIGARLRSLMWLAAAETGTSALLVVAVIVEFTNAAGGPVSLRSTLGLAGFVWLVSTCATALTAGLVGSPLADLLGYSFVDREFIWQRRLIAAGVLLGVLIVVARIGAVAMGAGPRVLNVLQMTAVAAVFLAWSLGWAYLIVGLLHLAAAAEAERDRRDEVFDVEDVDEIAPPEHRPVDELPDITLD